MSLIKSFKRNDQLLLDGFRYRRDRSVWRCVKANFKGRARYDRTTYEMYQDHEYQASDPNDIEKAPFTYEIKQKAELYHDPPSLIIHETRVELSFDTAIIVPQCTALQRTIQRIRRDKDIPTEPKTFGDIGVPSNRQNTVTNQKFLLYDNNDHHCRLLIFASKEQLDFLK